MKTLAQIAGDHPEVHLHVVYSRPGPQDEPGRDYQHTGHVNINLLRQQLPHGPHQFYVCGPAPMMETLVPDLLAWGVPQQDVHFEAFGPASVRLPAATPPVGDTQTGGIAFQGTANESGTATQTAPPRDPEVVKAETIASLLRELDVLVGLGTVKAEIRRHTSAH